MSMHTLQETGAAEAPGHSCPLHYRYHPEVFAARPPEGFSQLDVVYVVGGLYGK